MTPATAIRSLFSQRFGWGRPAIAAALILALAVMLAAPQPARAQLGFAAVEAAVSAVVGFINNTLVPILRAANSALSAANQTIQAFSDLWKRIVYPQALIDSARAMVGQIKAQFTSTAGLIHAINVLSGTLPASMSLEQLMRNRSITDFPQFDQAFRQTFQPVPPITNIEPGDQQRVDMDDALAMDTLKQLKAADWVAEQTLQAAQIIEDEAANDAPGSAAFLSGSGLVAAMENQATIQRMLAAELRQEATSLAHVNALRKRHADITSQFRGDATSAFH